MTPTQIDSLRDLAIEHLPRAKADREQIQRFNGTPEDFYSRLAHTAVMVRANAGATAVEYAAASVLEAVALLSMPREEPLTPKDRDNTLGRLATAANELCGLTVTVIPWLAAVPPPEPEDSGEEGPATMRHQPPHVASIVGRFLTTEEAAKALGVAPQTLRMWASTESGPVRPSSKIGRHHRWSGDEILALLRQKRM